MSTGIRGSRDGIWHTPEYAAWRGMIRRCESPKQAKFHRYGARGIAVCASWRADFKMFLADMGPRPSAKHSIDRINNDGNYEPGNVRWATMTEQQRNRSTSHRVTAFGKDLTIAEWAERTGLKPNTINMRLRRGGTPEEAVTPSGLELVRHLTALKRDGGKP